MYIGWHDEMNKYSDPFADVGILCQMQDNVIKKLWKPKFEAIMT